MKAEDIQQIVADVMQGKELFLVDVSVSKDNVIEVFVDSANGVDVSTCIGISREIEAHLDRDVEDFELTVSSAGIGYPFKVAGQYHKNIGKPVEVKFNDGSKLEGVLKSFDGTSVEIEYEEKVAVEGKKKKELVKKTRNIALTEIKQIKDIITF